MVQEYRVNLRMELADKRDMDRALERDKVTLSDFCRDAVRMSANLDPDAARLAKRLAADLRIDPAVVWSNILLRYFAEQDARDEVYGVTEAPLMEFGFTNKGPITGKPLFDMLRNDFLCKFQQQAKDEERRARE